MRKLSIVLVVIGTLWASASATIAWAADAPSTTTRVSEHVVTERGQELARGERSRTRPVPDRTNLVSVGWEGDPSASFTLETRTADGRWRADGEVAEADGGADAGSADAERAATHASSQWVSEPLVVKNPDDVRVKLADGTATQVHVTAFASPTRDLPPAKAASLVPGIALIGVGGAIAAIRHRRRTTALLAILVVTAGAVGVIGTANADAVPGDVPWPGQPRIVTRAELGIDESLRLSVCPSGPDLATPKLAIIHHTVNSNNYSQAGAADIVRNLYSYFINTRGYCDEAYNFLVDKFGTIYEGRAGGIRNGVVGAHATDFNTGTIGVSMIGEFDNVSPSGAMVNAISDLLAWKFTIHNLNPYAPVSTHGVVVDPIIGHRDAGAISGDGTGCPGNAGYSIIDPVRASVRPRVAFGWPYGRLDQARRGIGTARVSGWAVDPDVASPIQVHLYVDGRGVGGLTANLSRPDVGRAYPGYGNNHGFDGTIPVPPGNHIVCAYGISVANGGNVLLSCAPVDGSPYGALDVAKREGGPIRVKGWAIDPDTVNPTAVHVYVDGRAAGVTSANQSRPDVAAANPGYGNNHGFEVTVPAGVGNHTMCAYAISTGGEANQLIKCKSFDGRSFGRVTLARREGGPIHVRGWAVDPSTPNPTDVHLYLDGHAAAVVTADAPRPTVAAAYPGYGAAHQFETMVNAGTGHHILCAYAITRSPSPNALIGCGLFNGQAIGVVDGVTRSGNTVRVRGWAIDPSTANPATVHVYVDGRAAAVVAANGSRPDVASVYPGYGAAHGFDRNVAVGGGGHRICTYAISRGGLANPLLACRNA